MTGMVFVFGTATPLCRMNQPSGILFTKERKGKLENILERGNAEKAPNFKFQTPEKLQAPSSKLKHAGWKPAVPARRCRS
jgi:hypothetical protein